MSAAYAGVPDSLGAIFLFFITIPVMITLEDVYRTRVCGTSPLEPMGSLGFLWELAWLYVCVPWFAYTALRLPVRTSAVMPFSFVEEFGSQVVIGAVISGRILWTFVGEETI
ncbi:hypothetical protein N7510_005948 [Penicillium lagena]|uniref:uncharacterized protein n=1 Tax=Penicillium lagena TaxID=94218 RepID=UPI00254040E4|nr:uncharacterized protein N7510_005948 [Penicillium lagena]KAJ5612754.1 hypothetical protein N7510_005948 [Penicillium lagena]